MNFRRLLTKKLTIVATLAVVAVLVVALVTIPAGAVNQAPARPAGGEVLNGPPPAEIPPIINYQGYLTDSDGNPINDILGINFSIYETAEGGTPVWTELHYPVTVTDGLFNVLLGSIEPIYPVYLTGESYLGVTVGIDEEMTPRQQIVSVAYAIRSGVANFATNAEALDDMDSDEFVAVAGDTMTGQLVLPADGLVAGTDQLVLTDGKVGIGTAIPGGYKLHVQGGSNDGIYASGNSTGVFGYTTTGSAGVQGGHITAGNFGALGAGECGVRGTHGDTGNIGFLATGNEGVHGYSKKGLGVFGYSYNGTAGVWGVSGNRTGVGVYGVNDENGNYGELGTRYDGVYGFSNGTGVHGLGNSYGVYGSGNHVGVHGSGNDYGIRGYSYDDFGVYGYSYEGTGVYGIHQGTGNFGKLGTETCGVYGEITGHTYGSLGEVNNGAYGYGLGHIGVGGWSDVWDFFAYGPGSNYGPFTGAHEVRLAADFPHDFRAGLVVSFTGETRVRTYEGEVTFSSTLPTVRLADTPNDKTVFGVLIMESALAEDHWYQAGDGERFGIVNALGEGRVWVTNINGDIEPGDYITTSSIAGYGQKQDDDLLHSYTLGKATEAVDWSQVNETVDYDGQTYQAYAIAVVYTSG